MSKKTFGIIGSNVFIAVATIILFSTGFFSLNFASLEVSAFKFAFSVASLIFVLGALIYGDYKYVRYVSTLKFRNYKVEDQKIYNLAQARILLAEAKIENSSIESWIEQTEREIEAFQDKINIIKRLMANHGKSMSDWGWITDATNVTQSEILAYVREVLDSAILFNNDNHSDTNVTEATNKIKNANNGIAKISTKYDELMELIQKVLEKKLHKSGNIAIDNIDATIDSVKKVYGIDPTTDALKLDVNEIQNHSVSFSGGKAKEK